MSLKEKIFNSNFFVKFSVAATWLVMITIVIFAATQVKQLKTQYSFRDFFPKKHALLDTDEKFVKKFQLEEGSPFLVSLTLKEPNQTWLTPTRTDILKNITQMIQEIPGVNKVTSLANLEMAEQNSESIQIGPLLENIKPSRWKSWIREQNLIKSQLISEDYRSVLIVIEPASRATTDQQNLLRQLQTKLNKKAFKGQSVRVDVGGSPAFQARMSSQLESELKKFLFLSLSLFCVLMFLFYKTSSPVALTLVGLVLANLTSLAGLAIAQISFSILLSTLPIIVSTTFISLVLHALHRWADFLKLEKPQSWIEKQTLSLNLMKEMFLPNLLGSVTTAIGFLTLAWTIIPAIQKYALTVGAVVLWTWLFGQMILLLALPWINPKPRPWNQSQATWMIPILKMSIPIISLVIGISLVSGSSATRLNFSSRLFDDLPTTDPVRIATEKIDSKFGGILGLNLIILAPTADNWKNPKQMAELEILTKDIRKIKGVGSAISALDFLPRQALSSSEKLSEQYFLYSMSAANPLKNFLSSDEKDLRIAIRLHDLPSTSIEKTRQQIMTLAKLRFAESQVAETGPAVITHSLNQSLSHELVFGFWQSLAIIGILLGFVFKSARWALVACLPNLIPPAILMGALAVTQTPIKPGIALIFSIALGLAFNNTVYLLSRLKKIQKDSNMKGLPLKRALLMEGNPCLTESFVLFVGFLSFLLSQFQLNQTFGVFMLISIFAGFVGDLVFLPALLKEFPTWLHNGPKKYPKLRLIKSAKKLELKKDHARHEPLKKVASIALVFLALQAFTQTAKAVTANSSPEATLILKKMKSALQSQSDSATVKLKIIEKNGESKSRELKLKSLRTKKGGKVLARLSAPADVRGTALLASIDSGKASQWIYLPSSKQVRRITGAAAQGGILGSELSAEDLNPESLVSAKASVMSKTDDVIKLQIQLKSKTSAFSNVILSVSAKQFTPIEAAYFRGKTLAKKVEFQNYTQNAGIYRAQLIKVTNLINKRGTEVELKDIKVNSSLKESEFTPEALKDDF